MSRQILVFHSALTPDAMKDVLRRTIDKEQRTLFSFSGYRGDRPLLGEVSEDSFRLRKRRYSRNDFAGQLYARFEPEPGGTRIEGYFDVPRWAKYFMRIWLACAVLIAAPIFVMTMIDLRTGTHYMTGDLRVGLVVPPVLVLCGIVLPKFGRLLGKGDERFILEFVQNTLAARIEEPTLIR
jgi:hypothetical protein